MTSNHRNALGGRRSSLTDLDAEAQAKLIADHNQAQQDKMPSFGVEDIDTFGQAQQISIGLDRLTLAGLQNSSAIKGSLSLKHASQLTQSEDSGSDAEMDSGEENDKVMHIGTDFFAFRQIDYLWLFNNELKYNERPNFELDDNNVSIDDFQLMRAVNRGALTKFCKAKQLMDLQALGENPETDEVGDMMEEEEKEGWADECLDEVLKAILITYENGRNIPVDIVAHLEYFYNTLECSFSTKNPFECTPNFPALLFREPISSSNSSGGVSPGNQSQWKMRTLFEKHRAIIFPNSNANKSYSKSQGSSDISPSGRAAMMLAVNNQFSQNTAGSKDLLPKKYHWYPNGNILSPKCSRVAISPSPKNISSQFQRRGSAAVVQNPYTRVSGQYNNLQPTFGLQVVPTH